MANCIAWATGYDKSRQKEESRLGSVAAEGRAQTWRTLAIAFIRKDGSGYFELREKNSGVVLHRFDFGPEAER